MCGIIGVHGRDAVASTLTGLYALQHRGQEAAGVSWFDGHGIRRKVGPSTRIAHAEGCPRIDTGLETIPSDFLLCVQDGTVKNGLSGAYFDNIRLSGDPVMTRVDPQIRFQWTLFSPDPN